jgi:hypothetical protein
MIHFWYILVLNIQMLEFLKEEECKELKDWREPPVAQVTINSKDLHKKS